MVDYSEILMQSMDVLISKRLSDLQFDKTIICTIIDASNAEKGEYEVTDGATTFTAYSKDVTFKEEDSVYITIPNGDYGNQKLIVGKHVGQGESLTYISPLDTFINITGDLCNFTSTASLLANSMTTITDNDKTLQVPYRKTIWKGTVSNGKGFERLCIKADFKTWLKKLKVNSGNYGLCLFVSYLDKATVNAEDSIKIAQYILDSNDMYGNPYNFESFYTQSKTFDITNITGQITNLELVFYQDANFSTTTGEAAPTIDSSTGNNLMDNIFVQNISIGFGYDITKFTEDTVMIYCLNEPTYNLNNLTQENRKTLNLRWIRSTNEGIYSVDSEDEIPENAEIHWYKYQLKVQDEVDELAGPLWFEIEEGRNKLTLEVDPDVGEYTQQYKAIIEVPSRQWITNQLDEEMNIDYKLLKINAEGKSEDSEEVKLLSQYEFDIESQRKIYESDPIEFKSEVPVFDKMTADLINGLQIIVDEKGYKGNYLLYNLSNQIQNPNEASKMRIMRATYKSLVTGEQTLDGAESIIWKIPLVNSMIYPPEDGKEYKSSDVATSYWVENGYAYIKHLSGKSAAVSESAGTVTDWSAEQKFRIKDYYQESATNNTVYCYVVKNNVAYEASQELTFGPMGTNGTDFTFRMNFDSDIPGVTAGNSSPIKVYISLFDYNNERVPLFYQKGVKVTWYSKDTTQKIVFCDAEGTQLANQDEIIITTKEENDVYPSFYIKYIGDALSDDKVPLYYILQAKLNVNPTAGGGVTELGTVMLDCYLPVPYRSNSKYTGIEGSTRIIYKSDGSRPSYYDEPFTLWCGEEKQTNALWVCTNPETLAGAANKYYPFFKSAASGKFIVPSIYVRGLSKQINVTARIDDVIVWSNPVIMYCDAYTSALLNSWDGNLTIDEKNGTILSTMIGAGKKELDNSFSGVMMGDVTCAVDAAMKLGLYGFNHGLQSFGFTIDGKGFIGKSGQGQILFDGNRGTISSGAWRNSGGTVGMEIDLDGPTPANGDNWQSTGSTLKARGYAGSFELDTSITSNNKGNLLRIKDGSNNTLMMISTETSEDGDNVTSKYYLQSSVYNPGSEGTRLDLQNGKFTTYGTAGYVIIDSSSNGLFRVSAKSSDKYYNLMYVGSGASYYIQNLAWATSSGATGSKWNLNNGHFDAKGDGGSIAIHPDNGSGLFVVKDSTDKTILNVGTTYYLQSSDYDTAAHAGVRFDLKTGKITAFNFQVDAYASDSKYIKINSGADKYPLNVNGNFLVGWDGSAILKGAATLTVESGKIQSGGGGTKGKYYNLNENGGTIGPWHIDETAIYTKDGETRLSELGTKGTIRLENDNWKMSLLSTGFTIEGKGGCTGSNLCMNSSGFAIKCGTGTIEVGAKVADDSWGTFEWDEARISIGGAYMKISATSVSMSTNTANSGPYIYASDDRVQLRTEDGMTAPLLDLSNDRALLRANGSAIIELNSGACAITAETLTVNGNDIIELLTNVDKSLTDLQNKLPKWIFDYPSSPFPKKTT